VLLATIVLPFMQFPDSTPRTAVVLASLPLGITTLIRRALRGDRAALVGCLFSVWALVCAMFAEAAWMSVLGSFGRDTSALVIAGGFGLWAIGRGVTDNGRVAMAQVLLVCLGLSAGFGILQVIVRDQGGLVGLVSGRAHGLAGGHIYFGATMAGAACLAAVVLRRFSPLWLVSVFVFATCSNLSGSRFPVAVGLFVGACLFAIRRDLRALVAWCGAYLGGLLVSTLILKLLPGTSSAADRATAESAGRLEAWRYGWHALLERPVVGWGPLGFRGAVQGRFSAEFTADHAANELSQIWWDAHNILVGTAVSYGFLGLALFGVFVVLAVRGARGPLAPFVAALSLTWLLEPAGIATFPLVMLCLGVAMSGTGRGADVDRSLMRVLVLAGAVFGAAYLLTDVRLHTGMERRNPAAVASAAAWAPWDSVAANTAAAAYSNFDGSRPALEKSLMWMERARDRQPDFPFYSNKIAQLSLMLGRPDDALLAVDRALELQPWNVQALQLKYVVGSFTDSEHLSESATALLCEVGEQFVHPEESCPGE
jgi:O-antigen ligase